MGSLDTEWDQIRFKWNDRLMRPMISNHHRDIMTLEYRIRVWGRLSWAETVLIYVRSDHDSLIDG